MESDTFDWRNPFCVTYDFEMTIHNMYRLRDYLIPDLSFCFDSLYIDEAFRIIEVMKELIMENMELKRINNQDYSDEEDLMIDLAEIFINSGIEWINPKINPYPPYTIYDKQAETNTKAYN